MKGTEWCGVEEAAMWRNGVSEGVVSLCGRTRVYPVHYPRHPPTRLCCYSLPSPSTTTKLASKVARLRLRWGKGSRLDLT